MSTISRFAHNLFNGDVIKMKNRFGSIEAAHQAHFQFIQTNDEDNGTSPQHYTINRALGDEIKM